MVDTSLVPCSSTAVPPDLNLYVAHFALIGSFRSVYTLLGIGGPSYLSNVEY